MQQCLYISFCNHIKMPAYQPSPQELEIARELFPGQPDGFPFAGAFESSRVRLPADDDMGIDSNDDEAMEEVQTETGFGSVIGEDAR